MLARRFAAGARRRSGLAAGRGSLLTGLAPPGARSDAAPAVLRHNAVVDRTLGRSRSLVLTSLAHFTNDGTVFFVPVIAAIVAAHRGVPPLVVTLLFLVFYSSSTVLSLFVGRLSDRLGRPGSLIGLGLAILSAGLFGFYLALSYTGGPALTAALLVAAFLTGAGSSFYHPLGASLLQASFRDRSMGVALGVNGALGSLGRALYPSLYFVASAVIAGYGSVALFAAWGVVAGGLIWLGSREVTAARRVAGGVTATRGLAGEVTATRQLAGSREASAARRIAGEATAARRIAGSPGVAGEAIATPQPGRRPAEPAATTHAPSDAADPVAPARPADTVSASGASKTSASSRPGGRTSDTVTPGIVALTIVAFLRSSATQGIASWIPTYLATQKGLGVSGTLGLTVTTMYAAAIVGQPTFGLLVDRLDKRRVLALSSLGAAVSTVGYLQLGTGLAGVAWLFVFGFFVFSGFPLLLSMVGDYVPRGATSLANALVWGFGSTAGGAIGPLATGALIGGDYGRLGFAFTVLAGAAVVSAIATAFVPRATRPARMRAFS